MHLVDGDRQRHPGLVAALAVSHAMRESVLAAVTVAEATAETARDPVVTHAVALRSLLRGADDPPAAARLTGSEAGLLREWLDRLAG